MNKDYVVLQDENKIKAINCNAFLIREQQDSKFGGIDISEGAQVGSPRAVVAHGMFEGETTHVPHYGVTDMEYGGIEYAVCKDERLFAVERNGEWVPVNGYVKVRKCENDHIRDESGEIALYMTENHIETTNWVEVVDVADDCLRVKRDYIGLFCVAPESSERLARIEYTKDYCLHEDEIEFLTEG